MKVNTTTCLPAKFWSKCLGACIALAALEAQATTLPTADNFRANIPYSVVPVPFSGNLPAAVDHATMVSPTFTYAVVGQAPAGFVLNPNGSFIYTPPVGLFGHPATFQYKVSETGVVGDSASYNIDLFVVANGFNIAPGETLTLANQLAGKGPLYFSGGTVMLTNTSSTNPNSYTDGIVLDGSRLVLNSASQVSLDPINVRNGGLIDVRKTMTLANKVILG